MVAANKHPNGMTYLYAARDKFCDRCGKRLYPLDGRYYHFMGHPCPAQASAAPEIDQQSDTAVR